MAEDAESGAPVVSDVGQTADGANFPPQKAGSEEGAVESTGESHQRLVGHGGFHDGFAHVVAVPIFCFEPAV